MSGQDREFQCVDLEALLLNLNDINVIQLLSVCMCACSAIGLGLGPALWVTESPKP